MAIATKTLNPLHFEDLEPHRFEDLSRQLIYDFRNWSSIEAIGRLGQDEGIDIRAIEKFVKNPIEESEDSEDEATQNNFDERVWIIQCKREKSITPQKVERIINNDLSQQAETPYGYMLIAACDFSKRTRDVFRSTVLNLGVQEFYLWGKAEIEDLLFQPKNDHLLFAYFGISLQVRRRSVKTDLRSMLTLKRKLVNVLGELNKWHNKPVFIKDPRNEEYPFVSSNIDSIETLSWRYWEFYAYHPQNALIFITRRCFAYFDREQKQWDAIFDLDDAMPGHPKLHVSREIILKYRQNWGLYENYWKKKIPEENQAYYIELRGIPFERILAVDEIGDSWHEPPHLLVEYGTNGIPFNDKMNSFIQLDRRVYLEPFPVDELTKIKYFPDKIPEIAD